jgi:hypothetical protein
MTSRDHGGTRSPHLDVGALQPPLLASNGIVAHGANFPTWPFDGFPQQGFEPYVIYYKARLTLKVFSAWLSARWCTVTRLLSIVKQNIESVRAVALAVRAWAEQTPGLTCPHLTKRDMTFPVVS